MGLFETENLIRLDVDLRKRFGLTLGGISKSSWIVVIALEKNKDGKDLAVYNPSMIFSHPFPERQ